jgi:hypothetical protein
MPEVRGINDGPAGDPQRRECVDALLHVCARLVHADGGFQQRCMGASTVERREAFIEQHLRLPMRLQMRLNWSAVAEHTSTCPSFAQKLDHGA